MGLKPIVIWLAACAAAPAAAADMVWVTRSASGFPTYSFKPLDMYSQPLVRLPPRTATGSAEGAVPGGRYPRPPRDGSQRLSAADLRGLVERAARQYGVETPLVMAIIDVESGAQPNALSRAGAMGLMQLMPATARRYGVDDPWNPAANINGGVRYLRDLLRMFDGDVRLALAGYNAGEAAVLRHGRRIPPFAETQAYVPAVLARWRFWQAQWQHAAPSVSQRQLVAARFLPQAGLHP